MRAHEATVLLDLGPLTCGCTDHTLEFLHKALSDPPDAAGIWAPHENPWIRGTVEEFTRRGQRRLSAIERHLLGALGQLQQLRKAGEWALDAAAMTRAMEALQRKHPRDYTLDDWMLLADWLLWRYLPPNVIRSEADYLTARAAIAGKISAALPDARPAMNLDALLPASAAAAGAVMHFTPMQQAAMEIARTRAAELITNIGDQARHRIKRLIIDHLSRRQVGDHGATTRTLESAISDEFAILNRDWRRIAITEAGNAEAEGFIASLPPGSRVRRWEHYPTACAFCKKLHGMEFTVVDPSKEGRNGWKEVWVGKSNVGRSASPRKRVGDELVERTPEEMWWPAAGTQHPNCRGRWSTVYDAGSGIDARTRHFVSGLLAEHYPKS
jgi:hypothetical protein